MGKEQLTSLSIDEKLKIFIEENYDRVTKKDEKYMLEELRDFAGARSRDEVITDELRHLRELAARRGIGRYKYDGKNYYLPGRLAALKSLEDDDKNVERQLTNSEYIRLLIIAEMVTARFGEGRDARLHEEGFSAAHAQRAVELLELYKDINK